MTSAKNNTFKLLKYLLEKEFFQTKLTVHPVYKHFSSILNESTNDQIHLFNIPMADPGYKQPVLTKYQYADFLDLYFGGSWLDGAGWGGRGNTTTNVTHLLNQVQR